MPKNKDEPIHRKALEKAEKRALERGASLELSKVFKVLGNTTRVKILSALSERELCVHDLAILLGISQSAVSHQLRKLKDARIVKFRKRGREIFYSLDDEHVEKLLEMGIEHVEEE